MNKVVRAGKARYSIQERLKVESLNVEGKNLQLETFKPFNRIRVVPRRELFVPDVDEGFFV